jgi:hypothetical protein
LRKKVRRHRKLHEFIGVRRGGLGERPGEVEQVVGIGFRGLFLFPAARVGIFGGGVGVERAGNAVEFGEERFRFWIDRGLRSARLS